MSTASRDRRHFLLASLGVGAALLAGCGQGEYDRRMGNIGSVLARRPKGGGDAGGGGGGTVAADPVSLPTGTRPGLRMRVMSLFNTETNTLPSTMPRSKLMGQDLPGFCYTWERPLAEDSGRKIPAYMYVYAIPKPQSDDLYNQIQQALSTLGASGWVDAAPINNIPVKTIRASGAMTFEVDGAETSLPGVIEGYSIDGGSMQFFLLYRAEDNVANKHRFWQGVKASVATIEIENP